MQTASLVRDSYNELFSVHAATKLLKEHGHASAIHKLLEVITRHDLEDSLCIRLLHKHNSIHQDELMVEQSGFENGTFVLVTQAVRQKLSGPDVVPNSYRLTPGGFVPIEYSAPDLLNSPAVSPQTHPAAFNDIAEVISSLGLADVLGPALSYGDLVESHRPSADAVLLERTNLDHRANVVKFETISSANPDDAIETKWAATTVFNGGSKTFESVSLRCACSVAPEGGHLGTHVNIPYKVSRR